MTVVVEAVVTREKLSELLAQGGEIEGLDYKSECDLRDNAATVEFAKDFGAMQARGGYIVIGVDDHGRPVTTWPSDEAELFDEARVRSKMLQYFDEPLDIVIGRHNLETGPVVIVYVGPHPRGFAICTSIGQYGSGRDTKIPFREGDVLVRHGSASERWRQSDVPQIVQRIVAREKETWRAELAVDLARMGIGAIGQQLAASPASAFDWRVDEDTFRATLIELLRRRDYIPMRLLADAVTSDVRTLSASEKPDEIGTLLDRLTCMTSLAITLADAELLTVGVAALGHAYDFGFEIEAASNRSPSEQAARLWLMIVERVYAIGALAMRRSQWPAVQALALRRGHSPDGKQRRFRSWLRHALSVGSRAGLFEAELDGKRVKLHLIALARTHVDAHACLRSDLPPGDERILDSLCQFDLLAALAALTDTNKSDSYYPNFARYWSHRTTPIVERLLREPDFRQVIAPGIGDQRLADALRQIDRDAQHEAWNYDWDGFMSNEVERFLKEHPAQPSTGAS